MLKGGEHAAALRAQLEAVGKLQVQLRVGGAALDDRNYGKAKASLGAVVAGGVTADAEVRLQLLCRCVRADRYHAVTVPAARSSAGAAAAVAPISVSRSTSTRRARRSRRSP